MYNNNLAAFGIAKIFTGHSDVTGIIATLNAGKVSKHYLVLDVGLVQLYFYGCMCMSLAKAVFSQFHICFILTAVCRCMCKQFY